MLLGPVCAKSSKPAILLHVILRIQPGGGIFEEGRHVSFWVIKAVHPKLGQVDGTVPTDGVRLLDVGGEVREGIRGGLPVEVDEIDGAAGTFPEEVGEVGEGGGGPAVRHAGGSEEDLPGEGLHIGLIRRDGGSDAHARRLPVVAGVGFVEGEEGVGAVVLDAVLCVGGTDGG